MKNKWIILGVIGIILLALALILYLLPCDTCIEIDASVHLVYSPDNELALSIPLSALPPGLNVADISIKDISDEVSEETDGLVTKVYSLEPSGTKFSKPVDLSLNFNKEEGQALPLVMHIGENSLDVLSDAGYSIEDNQVTLNAEIDHFSVVTRMKPPFEFNFYGAGKYGLGASFMYDVKVKPIVGDITADLAIYYAEEDKGYMALAKLDRYAGWEVMPFPITATDGLTPTEATLPGSKGEGYDAVTFTQNYTCSKEGEHYIDMPKGIPIKFVVSWAKELEFLKDKQVQEGKNDYRTYWKYAVEAIHFVDHHYHWKRLNVKCWEQEMIRIGPPYLIDCGDGQPLTGISQADANTGEQLTDADGNPIDFTTGKAVKCPAQN
ncbi:hypothetical protein KAJ89_01860 [Candidatus Parcubacteria bacterium]|nr:hypothetical protein [Candidatus Parcubacteria bacterium]